MHWDHLRNVVVEVGEVQSEKRALKNTEGIQRQQKNSS